MKKRCFSRSSCCWLSKMLAELCPRKLATEKTMPGRSGQPMVRTYSGCAITAPFRCATHNVLCDTQRSAASISAMSNSFGDSAGVQSVERALAILDILARSGEAGVTAIASELGVHKSTAFRLVATLEHGGLVEQSEDRGKYRLGMGILRLAGATTARLDVVQEARPICRRLAADTGETVNVAVLSQSSALYLDQVAGSSSLQAHNWVGQHIPLHATSNGKVLLSGLDGADLDDV